MALHHEALPISFLCFYGYTAESRFDWRVIEIGVGRFVHYLVEVLAHFDRIFVYLGRGLLLTDARPKKRVRGLNRVFTCLLALELLVHFVGTSFFLVRTTRWVQTRFLGVLGVETRDYTRVRVSLACRFYH